jgi:hypothetical protein
VLLSLPSMDWGGLVILLIISLLSCELVQDQASSFLLGDSDLNQRLVECKHYVNALKL